MMTLLQDLHYALRQLRRSPGFAAVAILTLALAIGAATTMQTVVRGTLLAELRYPAAAELAGIGLGPAGSAPSGDQTGAAYDFLAAHATSFRSLGLAEDGPRGQNLALGGGFPRTVRAIHVNAAYFPTLGLQPTLGRGFTPEEDRPGSAPVVLLSEALWRTQLNADPGIVGRTLHLNADPYTVVGVVPTPGNEPEAPQVFETLRLSSRDPGYDGTNYQLTARLKSGVSLAAANAELALLDAELLRLHPDYAHWGGPGSLPLAEHAWPLRAVLVREARASILTLGAAVVAVLLVACLNLAGLLLARTARRGPELALRTALGAGRLSLLRLLLVETLLLAGAGSLLGLLFSRIALPLLVAASPVPLPQLRPFALDPAAALAVLLTGLAAAALFGLVPALRASRSANPQALGSSRTAAGTRAQRRMGQSLLVGEVTVATALLTAGAILLGTFLHLRAIPSGVRPQGLTLLQVDLKGTRYSSAAHTAQCIDQVEERLRVLPGVGAVSAAIGLPLDRGLNNAGGPLYRKGHLRYVESRFVAPGYFRTAGTPLLAGTDFAAAATAISAPVAIVNQRAAKLWWPDRSAVGESVLMGGGRPLRVIGIAADAHADSLAGGIAPTIYVPFAQIDDATAKMVNGWFSTTFLLRGPSAPSPQAVAAAVAAVDPELAVARYLPMQALLDTSVAAPRFYAWLAGGFALFALLLTLIGLFGLLSYQVSTRVREFGVRMALGASRGNILGLILGNGVALTAAGLVTGLPAGLFLRRLLAALLADSLGLGAQQLQPILADPARSLCLAAALMLVSAAAASLLPALRAASTQPTEALRAE